MGGRFYSNTKIKRSARNVQWALTQRASARKTFTTTTETCLFDQFRLLEIEQKIIGDYLQQVELTQILNKNELSLFIDHFLPFWFFIHCTYYTLRNDGHTQNKLYMIDEKAVDVTSDASRRFVERVPIPGLQNIDVVSAKTHDVHLTWINGAKNFHENQIQLHDFAIICHILVLRLAIEMFPQRQEPREQLNRLFRSIRQSVDENDENAEIRMGNMLLLINDVMRAVNEAHEWEIIFTLSFKMKLRSFLLSFLMLFSLFDVASSGPVSGSACAAVCAGALGTCVSAATLAAVFSRIRFMEAKKACEVIFYACGAGCTTVLVAPIP
ncbi:hypothetical protein M3Y95_00415200 [Aphelenchoides besseyi]|nr:hypothetical protein M3Y95_00415200 [Aphelenchoides besseyi]